MKALVHSFSALQRAEIAEIGLGCAYTTKQQRGFSALQRAEIAEMEYAKPDWASSRFGFSALQRAEIAEMDYGDAPLTYKGQVSVLFNEPKLLKYRPPLPAPPVSQIPIPARRRS